MLVIPERVKRIRVKKKYILQEKTLNRRLCEETYTPETEAMVGKIFDMYILEYITAMGMSTAEKVYTETLGYLKQAYVSRLNHMLRGEAGHQDHITTCWRIKLDGEIAPKELQGTWFKLSSKTGRWYFNRTFRAKANSLDFLNLFINAEWDWYFGGEAWARIAYYTYVLENAETNQEIIQAIDHIHQLSHNTASCMNKFADLEECYREVLDAKAHTYSISIMWPFLSKSVQTLYRTFKRRYKDHTWPMEESWARRA